MPFEIKVPYLGHNVESATINQWLKSEGDEVTEGEALLELEADKAVLEVEAPDSGILAAILKPEGSSVHPEMVIGTIAEPGEKIEKPVDPGKTVTVTRDVDPPATTVESSATALAATGKVPEQVVVIGGGPGGYTAAIKAAQRGATVTLVEKAKLGGTCLHTGCMPTKAYLAKARIINQLAEAKDIFAGSTGVKVNLKKLMTFKDKAVTNLTNGVKSLMKSNKIEVIAGEASFKDPNTLKIKPQKGKAYEMETEAVIIAAGSVPIEIPGVKTDGKLIHNTDTIWGLGTVPKKLLIAGSGAVGVEFACIYNAMGSDVTIVEMLDDAIPGINRETAETLTRSLFKKGIKLLTSTAITGTKKRGTKISAVLKKGDSENSESFDCVLVACGRRPESSSLNLESAGVNTEKNAIAVGADLQTSRENIYAIGDIIGQPMLAHAAFYEAEVAIANIFGEPTRVDYSKIPYCIYSFPEVGSIGLTEDQAKEKVPAYKTAQFPFIANGKAMVCGEIEGLVKILYDEALGEILGVHIIGEHATELIATFATAMTGELTIDEMADTLMAHPTLSEAMGEAAQAALGRALHLPKAR